MDGGLYFPESIPQISQDEMDRWSTLSYPELLKQIMPLFISPEEIPVVDLHGLVDRSFKKFSGMNSLNCYPHLSQCLTFPDPSVVKIANLKNGLNVAELFHGPTMAFKDLALGVVGELYNYFLERSKKHCIVLVGTSGDTGSAAISAVRGLSAIDIIVLLPGGRCTKIQQLQMTTVDEKNVHNFVGRNSRQKTEFFVLFTKSSARLYSAGNLNNQNKLFYS